MTIPTKLFAPEVDFNGAGLLWQGLDRCGRGWMLQQLPKYVCLGSNSSAQVAEVAIGRHVYGGERLSVLQKVLTQIPFFRLTFLCCFETSNRI